jgi:hypothetical protein
MCYILLYFVLFIIYFVTICTKYTCKCYTVDRRLRQFRKVDMSKPSIDFVEFDSDEGEKLLEEMDEVDEE